MQRFSDLIGNGHASLLNNKDGSELEAMQVWEQFLDQRDGMSFDGKSRKTVGNNDCERVDRRIGFARRMRSYVPDEGIMARFVELPAKVRAAARYVARSGAAECRRRTSVAVRSANGCA